MKKLLITLLLLSSVAIAQEKKYKIELTQAQLETIARAVQVSEAISAKDAAMLLADLSKQVNDTTKNKK